MGFSGRGRYEPEVAEVLSEIDASCFVVDVGQNNTVEELRERFGKFVAILRERRPDVPVLATTPIFYNTELWSTEYRRQAEEKRTIVRSAVEERRRSGDRMVYVLEAEDYLWSDFTDGSVNGGHPNDLGFTRMAEGMARRLREILRLPVHKLQR